MAEIVITGDGSHSIYVREMDEHYHSTYGALAESTHVFINAGLNCISKKEIRVFEMGFGTGLNAFLTFMQTAGTGTRVRYTGIEKYPLPKEITSELNYPDFFPPGSREVFGKIHDCAWNQAIEIRKDFHLVKIRGDIAASNIADKFDLVYFDAFAPEKQPGLWTTDIFRKIYDSMLPGGILTSYASKGEVRRSMASAGFRVEKLPGPPGKREFVRALKPL